MLKKVLIGVGGVVALLVAVVATRPATLRVERSAVIAAPAEVAYGHVANFRKWKAWSPWEERDPSQVSTYDGAESGKGARYAWKGNDEVGQGRMEILEAEAPRHLHLHLEFIEPFASVSTTTFKFEPEAGGTRVRWIMDSKNNFVSKAFGLFVDMDKMLGADFEKGLASLARVAEAEAQAQPQPPAEGTAQAP